jgi:hypothetical protein
MSPECPCFNETVDRNVTRTTSFLVFVLLLTGLFSMLNWISLLLCFDFFIRGFTHLPISPLRRAAQAQVKILRFKPKMINAGPRVYGARVGFVITALITLLSFTGFPTGARILTELMVLIAGLAAFLGICIGCYVHTLIQKAKRAHRSKAG